MAAQDAPDLIELPLLYNRDARGVVREYKVWIEVSDRGEVMLYRRSRIRETTSGDPGKPVVHVRVIKGKAKRTDLEQAQNMAQKYWEDQRDKKGYTEELPGANPAPAQAPGLINIRANIPMTAYIYDPLKSKVRFPVFIQPKYDGSRTLAVCEQTQPNSPNVLRFYSRSRKLTYTMPHIGQVLQPILCGLPEFAGLILDGELMNDNNRQWESSGIMRRQNDEDPSEEYLQHVKDTYLVLYDCYTPGQENTPFRDRFNRLRELYRQIPATAHRTIRLAPTTVANSPADIEEAFGRFIEEGHEGAMLRNMQGSYRHNRTQDLLKYKAVQEGDFLIVDVIPAENEPGSRLVLEAPSGKRFTVRPRGDLEYRRYLLENRNNIVGLKATIQYATLSEDAIPQHPRVHPAQPNGHGYLRLDMDAQVREV